MKKANYKFNASAATKALKDNRIICQVADNGAIYVTNGYIGYKLTSAEYDAIVRPITKRDAGNYSFTKDGASDSNMNIKDIIDKTVKALPADATMHKSPLLFDTGAFTVRAFYNVVNEFSAFYKELYISAFGSAVTFRAGSYCSGAIAIFDSEVIGIILPVRPDDDNKRAVYAYYNSVEKSGDNDSNDSNDDNDKIKRELRRAKSEAEIAKAELEAAKEEIEKLRAEIEAAKAEKPAAENPAEIASPENIAENIVKRFADMSGVTAVIKGAKTASPVIWLSGAVEKYTAAIEAAGAVWSNKKSAYYVRVA